MRQISTRSLRLLPTHHLCRQSPSTLSRKSYSTTTDNPVPANNPKPKVSENQVDVISPTNVYPSSSGGAHSRALVEPPEEAEEQRQMQAPNRKNVWTRSQQPREKAMVGPRFEQMIMRDQPRPLAAIELIHQQPVRWTHERRVSCDGGGGPLGHPRIFINTDKPQICFCTYCGIPFAHEHHREHLESLSSTSYPLEPTNKPAQLPRVAPGDAKTGATEAYQTSTGQPYEQR